MASRLTTLIVASIVSATLIAGIITRAQRDDEGPVDLMVVNGRVYPGQGAPFAEAVAVRGNTIVRVGTNREIRRLRRPQTTVIDAAGGLVVPGFNDALVHLLDGGLQAPDKGVIDDAAAENPATDAVEANPVAAESASATAPPDREQHLIALRRAVNEVHRRGITSVQSTGGTPEQLALLDALRQRNELPLRTYQALATATPLSDMDLERLDATRREFDDDPLLKTGAVEVVAEAPSAPVTQTDRTAGPLTSEQLQRLVISLDRRGWQVWVRTATAHGLRMALDAFQAAEIANPVPRQGRRHRIVHAGTFGPEDVARLVTLGLTAVVSAPVADPAGGETDPAPGPTNLPVAETWTTLAAANVRLVVGSGWPTRPGDPSAVLEAVAGLTEEALAGGDAEGAPVSLTAAIDACTSAGAHASFDEQRKGTLARGMLADIVVLSRSFSADEDLPRPAVEVDVTIFDGHVVYRRPGTGAD